MLSKSYKINEFIEKLIPPVKSMVAILAVTYGETYLLPQKHRNNEPIGIGVMEVENSIFTGRQYFSFFEGCTIRTKEGRKYVLL